jgi:hypothetical protein
MGCIPCSIKYGMVRINRDFPELFAPTTIVIGAKPSSSNRPAFVVS